MNYYQTNLNLQDYYITECTVGNVRYPDAKSLPGGAFLLNELKYIPFIESILCYSKIVQKVTEETRP